MEIRQFASRILTSESLDIKLQPPGKNLTDQFPGTPHRIDTPARPPNLQIVSSRKTKVPPLAGMRDPHQRARILHALANHELQAVELFAWALLAFPAADSKFRRGLVAILAEEQRHFHLYAQRLNDFGILFGAHPVTGHFWNNLDKIHTPLDYICTMGLTFENANLDFAQDYATAARSAGDETTAVILEQVHQDEIRHVHFAWHWLQQLKPADQSPWKTYTATMQWPLGPSRARGKNFDSISRRRAGLDEEFIDNLAATESKRPGGGSR